MLMDGPGQKMGAVADLRKVKQVAAVAWSVMNHTKHSFIVGNQATEFALKMGFQKHSLKTELSTKMHQDWLKANCQPNFWKASNISKVEKII
jgi:N4-(beta-N-acetylglucosaminyl)-L-asparaginase